MFYSQKSYPKTQLGFCKGETISKSGCFLTSFCSLLHELNVADIDPPEFNKIAFKSGCLANAYYWASLYNLNYQKVFKLPNIVCIAETNYYSKSGVPQHFFLIRPDGKIVDPLDTNPTWKTSKYNVVSYRVFTRKMTPKIDPPEEKVPEPILTPTPPQKPPETIVEPPAKPEITYDKPTGVIIEKNGYKESIPELSEKDLGVIQKYVDIWINWLIKFLKI